MWGRALTWMVTCYVALGEALERTRIMVRWMFAWLANKITTETARRAPR